MEKKRVPYGEKFWFIRTDGRINYGREYEDLYCNAFFNCGNYFHTKEEAERMKRLFDAVLNGADVIQMPSEEEIKLASNEEINCWCEEGDPHQYVDCDICATPVYRKMFIKGANWLKSKITK